MDRLTLVVAGFVALGACGGERTARAPAATASPARSANTNTNTTPAEHAASANTAEPATTSSDVLLATMLEYRDKMLPIVIGFSGDCEASAERLLALEPLARTIRTHAEKLETNLQARDAFADRMNDMEDSAHARMDARLKELGATRADLARKQAELKKACAGNASYTDAMQRVGLKQMKIY